MNTFNQIFTNFSTLLLWPVILTLSLFLIHALYRLGEFLGNYRERKTIVKNWRELRQKNRSNSLTLQDWATGLQKHPHLAEPLNQVLAYQNNMSEVEHIFADLESKLDGRMQALRNYLRMGPMLGLMGTLIPMGPALVGLAAGDIASMAANLQIAFSTTVVGVFLGLIGFVLFNKEKAWKEADLMAMEYILSQTLEFNHETV
jgi:biopolymer transport protein ExbB/TolQ